MAGQGGDTSADISTTKKSVLLVMKRLVCTFDTGKEECSSHKEGMCLILDTEVFGSQWGSSTTSTENLAAAKAATTIMRKSRMCSVLAPRIPANNTGTACSTQNPCVSGSNTCLGPDNAPGAGSCNSFCPSSEFYRADLGGCVPEFCKCPTEAACADNHFKTTCASSCPAQYLLSQGYNNTMRFPAANNCTTSGSQNVLDHSNTKVKLF